MKATVYQLWTVLVLALTHPVSAQFGTDYGDAPDPTYPTCAANSGAFHLIVPGVMMGISIDGEIDGQPTFLAQGDDLSLSDDEDGVLINSWVIPGQNASVIVRVSAPGMLDAWIDFNIDGDWLDAGEQIFTNTQLVPGLNFLSFVVPISNPIIVGQSFTRFRFSAPGNLSPYGIAPDGEVEDYPVWLGLPVLSDTYLDPDPTMSFTQNEISLACIPDPNFGNPSLIVAAYNDEPFPGGPGMGVSYSTDGGNNWANTHLAYPINPFTGVPFLDVFDPTVCIDDSGHVFVGQVATDYNWGIGPASGLYVHKSIDGGVTWQTPVKVSADGSPVSNPDSTYRLNDRDQIVADNYAMSPYYNTIYITWIKDRGWNMPQPWGDIYFSRSTDGGTTFSNPLRINTWANNMGNMPVADVAKDGTVYVVWVDYNVHSGGQGVIFLDRSTDGGVTFGSDIIVDTINLPLINLNGGTDARAKGAAVLKVLPSNPNELYLVFAEAADPTGLDEADIFLIKSTDGGNTWTNPLKVNDDNTSNDQILPWIYIKPNGIIDIAWYDRRNDPGDMMWDIYYTYSTDGGNTFASNIRVNTTSFVTPTPPKVFDPWMGEYLGLVADYTQAYIAFTSSIPDNHGDVLFTKTGNPDPGMDWGDTPDPPYPTRAINDGARHANDGVTWLGFYCDNEPDALSNLAATGDDLFNAVDDEDGVLFPAILKRGRTDTLKVTASANGFLSAWFDFNADGDWADTGENILVDVALNPGLNTILLSIPMTAQPDTTYARFRFSTHTGLGYTGAATDGEAEDYQVVILDSVPATLSVYGVTINSGQSSCYNAMDTLLVAGFSPVVFNTNVIINTGGDATFIAGRVISFRYGFHACQGSTVDAHIASGGNYCNGSQGAMIPNSSIGNEIIIEPETFDSEIPEIRIYPNPNTGKFILEFRMEEFSAVISVINFQGVRLNQVHVTDQHVVEMDISSLPSGMYLVMVQTEGKVVARKMIKW